MIGRAALIVALCLSLGLQWFALQSFAWATMLVENARSAPLSEAVARTFDGAHPCDLCHAVAAGKKAEKKTEALPVFAKVDFICPPRLTLRPPAPAPFVYQALTVVALTRSQPPPVPPPRLLS